MLRILLMLLIAMTASILEWSDLWKFDRQGLLNVRHASTFDLIEVLCYVDTDSQTSSCVQRFEPCIRLYKQLLALPIKTIPLQARMFGWLYEMGAEHSSLIFLRWLCRGSILRQVSELVDEIYLYLAEINQQCIFTNSDFIMKMAYLSDIFERLDTLNTSFQGSDNNIQLREKLKSFIKKTLNCDSGKWEVKLCTCTNLYPELHFFTEITL
jgi:hypothetical protein